MLRLRRTFPEIEEEQKSWRVVRHYQEQERQIILGNYEDAENGVEAEYDASCERRHLFREMFPKEYGREVLKSKRMAEEDATRGHARHEEKRKHIAKAHKKDEPYYVANPHSRRKKEEGVEVKEISGVAAHCRSRDHLPPPSAAPEKMKGEEIQKKPEMEKISEQEGKEVSINKP